MSNVRSEILYYTNQIKGMTVTRAAAFLKREYEEYRLTRCAYDYLERNLEDIV